MILITQDFDGIYITRDISDIDITDDGFCDTINAETFQNAFLVREILDALYRNDFVPSDALEDGLALIIKDGVCQTLPNYLVERAKKQVSQEYNEKVEKVTENIVTELFDKTFENLQLTREALKETIELFPKQLSESASSNTIINKTNKKKFLL